MDNSTDNLINTLIQARRPFMLLELLVEDASLISHYNNYVTSHNNKILQTLDYPDAGFDLFVPYCHEFNDVGSRQLVNYKVNKLNMAVKCAARMFDKDGNSTNTGYYLYPRSSISKTCIRMANSVGIIDAGYRGPIIAMVDVVYGDVCFVDAYEKLFQICAPGLVPIVVDLVNGFQEKTARGEGGFGSTNVV